MTTPAAHPAPSSHRSTIVLRLAALTALVGVVGSLHLSLSMGLKACPLCLYQRGFLMAVAGILVMGRIVGPHAPGALASLALPGAVAAVAISAFHVSLELRRVLECPAGVFGLGSAPQQALLVLTAMTGLLLVDAVRARRITAASTAMALGLLFAFACVRSGPPLVVPKEPYKDSIPDGCRPPYIAVVVRAG